MSLVDTKPNLRWLTPAAVARAVSALRGWRRVLFSILLGAASVGAFAPFHIWPLLFVIFPAFVWLLDGIAEGAATRSRRATWRQAALTGWGFGFGFFFAGLYWLGFAFFVEADKFAWLMPLAVAALPAGLALFYAVAAWAAIALWRPGAARIFILAATLFGAEWLRGHILTGFPWNLWGYAFAGNAALAQTTSIFGIYSLTLLTLLIAASPAALAGSTARQAARSWLLPAICLALLASGWLWGEVRLAGATDAVDPGVKLRIVQANVPQAEKWKPENRKWIFERLLTLSANGPPGTEATGITHLIWPETSVPFLFMLNGSIASPEARKAFADLVGDGTSFIVGAERIEGTKRPDGRYNVDHVFNSLFMLDGEARLLGIYDKMHLVPFGEYVPFEKTMAALGIMQLTHMNSGFSSGTGRTVMNTAGAPSYTPLICYEAIFPQGVMTDDGNRPGWLLNLTNDAWFGTSTGPYQHLHQTRLRAIEQGLPLIRAANTGISAVIDSYGRVLASLPLNTMGAIDHALPVALAPTPYSLWGERWLMMVAFLVFLLYRIVTVVE